MAILRNGMTITSSRRTTMMTQRRIRSNAISLINNIVVVRTFAGTFVGCLRAVTSTGVIRLKVFSGIDRRFVIINIPIFIVFDLFKFTCP